jgi:hypothetical protein
VQLTVQGAHTTCLWGLKHFGGWLAKKQMRP